ncbi:hypothetical protein R1sor_020449 [Riccia sorocarpa]|uniref:Phospho-N-acetylmuramoyl-pentapeptide-transferase n=1 Tax=Riccia sorocarpa TaxID=122646 RepID=A0ABD3II81_9MARC
MALPQTALSSVPGPGLPVKNPPLKVFSTSSVGMRSFWRSIPCAPEFGNIVKPSHKSQIDIATAPRVNGRFGFSGAAAIRNCRQGLGKFSCCTLASCENYSTGPKRPLGHSHVVAVKVFYSDMSAKDPENFASVPKVEEIYAAEQTVGNPELTDIPLLDETAVRTTLDANDPNSEARFAKMTAAGYFTLALGSLLLVDCYLQRITPGPLWFLTKPFLVSAAISAICGYVCVPLLRKIKAAQIIRKEGPATHLVKSGTPSMGGLFFIPVGLTVAAIFTGTANVEVRGAIALTLVYGGIGLLDDTLSLVRKHNYGLPGRIKFVLQVVAGIGFFLWLKSANVSSSNITKTVVPLPAPVGHLHLGKWYMALTAFCCTAMSNGVNLTDGLDGLAGGTAAAAFIGMAVAVLPLCPALGRFGSSMAGACFGFLVHNRYKAEVFMGDTGSLALGGALAAMAASTGMFFPLFVASGIFVVETLSVIGQVSYFQLTKRLYGEGRRWLRMAPLHHHLEFLGFFETRISTLAYALGIILSTLAAYSGLLLS